MKDYAEISWERFLNPAILRTNLMVAAIFITSFELLKDTIVEHIRHFFSHGFNKDGLIISEKYKVDVLSLNKSKSPLYASLEWLKKMEVIDNQDIEEFNEIKNCRNEIAHEMVNFISEDSKIDPLPLLPKIIELLSKIEKWWILNVEIPTNPDFDGKEINEDNIVPGPVMTLRLLTDIAFGSEEESVFIIKNLSNIEKTYNLHLEPTLWK